MGSDSLVFEIAKVVGFLGVLVALALYLVRLRKRVFSGGYGKGPYLSLIETLSLGQNRFLCLVKAGDSHLLLGVTPSNITLLKEAKLEEEPGTQKGESGSEQSSRAERGSNDAEQVKESEENVHQGDEFSSLLSEKLNLLKKTWKRRLPFLGLLLLAGITLLWTCPVKAAPSSSQDLPLPDVNIQINGVEGQGGLMTSLGILAVLTVLTLAPAILILTTCFTRIIVVFSFLRAGLGTQQTPPNQVLIGLALLLTFFVMTPTWSQVNEVAIKPYVAGEITAQKALELGEGPVKDFMLRQTREEDLALFASVSGQQNPQSPQDLTLVQIVPAFAISELRTAFEMGFILFLPFLIIDMVVASTLMSMGMLMLPPILISLPFKILLFVLVDGWALVVRSLISSFR